MHTQQQQLSSLPYFTWSIQRIAYFSSLSLNNVSPAPPLRRCDPPLSGAARYRAPTRIAV